MKILVTGSDGFVGKYVVAELKNNKHYVKEYDMQHGKNIFNRLLLEEEMKGTDVVIHLAAILDNENSELWKVNVEGTQNVIEEAVKARVKKFVYLSSTGVYGLSECGVNEKSEINPANAYEKSKAEGERIVLGHQEEISVSVLRSAMVFGPNPYWKKMFELLEKGIPLPCNGKNTFQVTYVKELARVLIKVIEKGEDGETYLIAGKETMTLNEFCAEVKKQLGVRGKVKHLPTWLALLLGKMMRIKVMTKENIRHLSKERRYDLRKIYGLGYEQKTTMKEAITETITELKEEDVGTMQNEA